MVDNPPSDSKTPLKADQPLRWEFAAALLCLKILKTEKWLHERCPSEDGVGH
ncbi:MAG: hypothetical protein HYR63_10465 [Proteobacteria bacterium]|nr:hypothetical protein [Pseudomonadota bacterium]